jgi:carbonic anhydrase
MNLLPLMLFALSSVAAVHPEAALERLRDGNARVVSGKAACPHQSIEDRVALARGQRPFAVVVSCSDSRVPPEIVFDQGMGDLFVIRVAGEVLDAAALGSIEYALDHFGTKLVVVLGHERCGAVTAAIDGGKASPNVMAIISAIRPAVEAVADRKGDKVDLAVRANVERVVTQIRTAIAAEGVEVTGMYYDLDTGKIENIP